MNDFPPMTTEAKSKVLDHYREVLRQAQELSRLDALPKSERAKELREALVDSVWRTLLRGNV